MFRFRFTVNVVLQLENYGKVKNLKKHCDKFEKFDYGKERYLSFGFNQHSPKFTSFCEAFTPLKELMQSSITQTHCFFHTCRSCAAFQKHGEDLLFKPLAKLN